MTKKDYKLIAGAIKESRQEIAKLNADISGMFAGIDTTTALIAKALKEDNPNFSAEKFIKAIIN